MATQNFKRNLFLNFYREGGKNLTLVCLLLPLKREIKKKKNVWHLQPISSSWRSLVFLPVSFSLQKNIYFCFMDYDKSFDCVDHNKLWQILKAMVISDHLTCLLRNLYARQEATVRTRRGTMDWFKIWEGLHQSCMLSLCYLIYMQSTSCECQAGWSSSWNHDCWEKYQ